MGEWLKVVVKWGLLKEQQSSNTKHTIMENTADEWLCLFSSYCCIHSNLQEFIISVFVIHAIGLICGSQLNLSWPSSCGH